MGNRRELSYEVVRDALPPDIAVLAPVSGYGTWKAAVPFIGSTEPNATLTIDGVAVPLEEGNFVSEVGLKAGDNTFFLEAEE